MDLSYNNKSLPMVETKQKKKNKSENYPILMNISVFIY